MTKATFSSTAGTVARSQSHHNRHTKLPILPTPPPPPHDDDRQSSVVLQLQDEKKAQPLPPLPSKKTFYDNNNKLSRPQEEGSSAFVESFMARYPTVSRHRRRFAALLCTIGTLLLLFIVLLSVFLSRRTSSDERLGHGTGRGGSGSIVLDPKTEDDIMKHNIGIPKPPINYSDAPGWIRRGQGDGTYYDPGLRNSVGGFQPGACEFEYINSVTDFIAALNKPDFGSYPRANRSPACGQCLQVTGPKGTIQVQIVDLCPSCKSGDVDLTPAAFLKIADLEKGRVHISWERCSR